MQKPKSLSPAKGFKFRQKHRIQISKVGGKIQERIVSQSIDCQSSSQVCCVQRRMNGSRKPKTQSSEETNVKT